MMEESKKNGYFSYYIFIFVSAIIGFFTLLFVTRSLITISFEKGIVDFTGKKAFFSTLVSIIGVILFVFISIIFKKVFKKIFLSEIVLYLYMGFLTTAINIIAFKFFLNIFSKNAGVEGIGWKVAELFAFIVAILFAFVTNKLFVFKSLDFKFAIIGTEFIKFTIGRVITEVINFLMMYVMIDVKKLNEMLTKILASIIVIILNYIFSKFIIFKGDNSING